MFIDGADQFAFGLPHFTTATKDFRGHKIKIQPDGIVEHYVGTHWLSLFALIK